MACCGNCVEGLDCAGRAPWEIGAVSPGPQVDAVSLAMQSRGSKSTPARGFGGRVPEYFGRAQLGDWSAATSELARVRWGADAPPIPMGPIVIGQGNVHAHARGVVLRAFREVFGRPPNEGEAQAAQLVGWLESHYGRGWRSSGVGSNNWGAIQGGIASGSCSPNTPPPVCAPGAGFLHGDTQPQPDGSSKHYMCCYRVYPTEEAGAADLIRVMYGGKRERVRQAAARGDLEGVSREMYDTGYYQGFGATREQRIAGHHKRMKRDLPRIAEAAGFAPAFNGAGGELGGAGAMGLAAVGGALLISAAGVLVWMVT